MNDPIFIFSLDSIIECCFDYCFLKNYTFFSSSRVRASLTCDQAFFLGIIGRGHDLRLGRVLKFKPKQTVCNGPDLLENTIVKLRSMYVR